MTSYDNAKGSVANRYHRRDKRVVVENNIEDRSWIGRLSEQLNGLVLMDDQLHTRRVF